MKLKMVLSFLLYTIILHSFGFSQSSINFSSDGGNGTLKASYRFCSSSSSASWCSVPNTSYGSKYGPSTITYTISKNLGPGARHCTITTTQVGSDNVCAGFITTTVDQAPPPNIPSPNPPPPPTCQTFTIQASSALASQCGSFDYYYNVTRDPRVASASTAVYQWRFDGGPLDFVDGLSSKTFHIKANICSLGGNSITIYVSSSDGCKTQVTQTFIP